MISTINKKEEDDIKSLQDSLKNVNESVDLLKKGLFLEVIKIFLWHFNDKEISTFSLDYLDPAQEKAIFNTEFPKAQSITENSIETAFMTVFIANIKVMTENDFFRNLLEVLLFPLSKTCDLNYKTLLITESSATMYKDLFFKNNTLRQYLQEFVFKILNSSKTSKAFQITPHIKFRDFKNNPYIKSISNKIKSNDNQLLMDDRFFLTACFFQVLIYEVLNNTNRTRIDRGNTKLKYILQLINNTSK
jgi:hypothetical protein